MWYWSGPGIMNFSFSEPKMQPAGVKVYFLFSMQELVHVWPKYYSLFCQAKKIQKYNDAGRYFVSLQNLWRVIWDYTHILKKKKNNFLPLFSKVKSLVKHLTNMAMPEKQISYFIWPNVLFSFFNMSVTLIKDWGKCRISSVICGSARKTYF